MRVRRDEAGALRAVIELGGPSRHVPSVDLLFESAVAACGAGVLGVVLTGMGDDGSRGAAAVRKADGRVIAEASESCIVYGMPRCVIDPGLASETLPLDEIVAGMIRNL